MNNINDIDDMKSMKLDNFTDEELLNIVNNTIEQKTNYRINEFTGGSVLMTSTRSHTKETYKVNLLFGYKNGNSKSVGIYIKKELVYVWTKALLLKITSLKLDDMGMDLNEIHGLMKKKEENNELNGDKRTSSYYSSTMSYHTPNQLPNTTLPFTCSDNSTKISDWLAMKRFILENKKTPNGTSIEFMFDGKIVCISDKDIPYFKNKGSSPSLNFQESDMFYQYLYKNLDETIELINYQKENAS